MYRSCPLTTEHKLTRFDCGVQPLNEWLTGHALRAQVAGSARTFVWTPAPQPQDVVAYFSLAPTVVTQGSVSRSTAGGVSQIPAYLIGKLVPRELGAPHSGGGYPHSIERCTAKD
ncbi:MAG: hypothetical protein Q8P38_12105 [Candidatus Nanopelagicales bacterium]|nr:hypothetical protein [Candidatus Nanopelagicales bacterium]